MRPCSAGCGKPARKTPKGYKKTCGDPACVKARVGSTGAANAASREARLASSRAEARRTRLVASYVRIIEDAHARALRDLKKGVRAELGKMAREKGHPKGTPRQVVASCGHETVALYDRPIRLCVPCKRREKRRQDKARHGERAWTMTVEEAVAAFDQTCQTCGKKTLPAYVWGDPMSPTRGHVIPHSQGGEADWANMVLQHEVCNRDLGEDAYTSSLLAS